MLDNKNEELVNIPKYNYIINDFYKIDTQIFLFLGKS